MEATAETVEERLRDLQDRGLLGDDELDDHAQAALRKADPDIAMEALAQWERSSHKRRNPSACMVSLLKKLNDQGSDIGQRGAVEPDVATTQQAEDLMARLGDKIDSSANRALRDLEPTEALSILTDMVNAGDTIRNHSAFVMSATKRFKDQARSSGSRRRDPPRLQQGPYADHQDGGCGYGGFGYDTENVYSHDRSYDNDQDEGPDNYRSYGSRYNGRSREDDSGYRRDRSYDNDRDENDYPSYSSRYNERGREDDDSGYRYDQRSRSGGYDRGYSGYRESHDYYDGGDRGDRRNRIEELIDGLNVDTGAREALGEIPEGKQVMLLEELTEDAHKVRNHSAFIISNVKRIKDGTYYPRKRETSYEDRSSHGQDYSYSYNCYVSHSGSYEREDREMRDDRGQREDRDNDNGYHDREQKAWSSTNDLWDSLDAKAQTALKGISSEDAASLLEDLKSRNHVRNASAWICAKAKRFPQEQASPEFEDRQRSRSPRRGVINLTPIARQDEANDEMEKEYAAKVRTLVDESDIMLDEHAKAALKAVPGYQGLQVFHHVVQDTQGSIRNPSAFVVKKCREIAKQNGTESQFLKETNSACETREGQPAPIAARPEAERPEAPREASSGPALGGWRSMPLDQWLRSVDNGKGYLLQYEQGLLKNYDNLEQIMELYVAPPGDDGKISIDQTFFADLTAGSNVEMKVGHKRMFEKWFKDHWNS